MSADNALNPDLAAFAETLSDRTHGALTIALAELAAIMRPAKPVRDVPSARFAADNLMLPQAQSIQILGKQLDRRQVTLWLDAGTTCYIAPSQDTARAGGGAAKLSVTGGRLVLATSAEIWAYATGTDSCLCWIVEEYDA